MKRASRWVIEVWLVCEGRNLLRPNSHVGVISPLPLAFKNPREQGLLPVIHVVRLIRLVSERCEHRRWLSFGISTPQKVCQRNGLMQSKPLRGAIEVERVIKVDILDADSPA